jgi:EAL and modified HD-GYP domain-containing signal transduction protein
LSVFLGMDGKPQELTVTALVRGRFCELAGQQQQRRASRSELFTIGLFSVIDALMDTPIDELLAQLPFPADMCDALTRHEGENGCLLECVEALESGHFERAHELLPNSGELYLESLKWADQASVLR